jgi:hypothetical protein
MATLTETAFYARKTIKWAVFALIGLTILRILFGAALDAFQRAFPTPPLKPNHGFGKLPAISFPQVASPSGQLTFTLQTVTGDISEASDAAKVYFMPKNRINLLSLSKSQQFASKLAFTSTPRQMSDTKYRWLDLKNPLRSLEIDIVSNHFLLKYAYTHDLALFSEKNIPTSAAAINEAFIFLQNLGLNQTDLDMARAKVTYLKLVGDTLEPTTSQSQANAVKVHFFRKDYDGFPTVTDSPKEAHVTIILSSNRSSDKRVLQVDFAYWPIDTRTVAIYKLKTAQEAWSEVTAGKAYYASLPQAPTVPITNVYLAYYDSRLPQFYMQPVFVFEGENDFVVYVPAVQSIWTE